MTKKELNEKSMQIIYLLSEIKLETKKIHKKLFVKHDELKTEENWNMFMRENIAFSDIYEECEEFCSMFNEIDH